MSTPKDWKWVATNSPEANSRTDETPGSTLFPRTAAYQKALRKVLEANEFNAPVPVRFFHAIFSNSRPCSPTSPCKLENTTVSRLDDLNDIYDWWPQMVYEENG